MIQIYHNPRCGKSRACLAFLNDSNQEYEVKLYLTESPSVAELESLLQKLKIKPIDLVRKKERVWIDEYKNEPLTDSQIIQILAEHPILIERPILIKGDDAIIARGPEKIALFLNKC